MSDKNIGSDFNDHLLEALKYDDLAVYYYISLVDINDKDELADAIKNVVVARSK